MVAVVLSVVKAFGYARRWGQMAKIKIDQLAAEIARGLAEYSQDVVEKVNVSSEKVGKAAVKQLRQTSPKKTGKYAKSCRS